MTISEPTGAFLARGGLLVLVPLFLLSTLILYLVLERSRSLGLELLDLVPRLRKKKKAAGGQLRASLLAYLGAPTLDRRDALRAACVDLNMPLARFGSRLSAEGIGHDRSLGSLEVREAAFLADREIGRNLPLIGTLSRAALLLGLLASFHGLAEMFHSMWFGSPLEPGSSTSGLLPALILSLLAITVSLMGTICAGLLARRAARLGDELQEVNERISGRFGGGMR
jgi:biopolymer transport protein ExbB/TolQ